MDRTRYNNIHIWRWDKFLKYRLIVVFLLVALFISIIPTGVFADEKTLPSRIPDSEIGNRIDAYIKEYKDTTAAVSIAVFRGQETIYKTGYGYANIKSNLVVNDETVYEWGSVSKLLVWVSVMQLGEQGRISLDADVKEYLPKGFLTKLQYDEPITMKNLMNHNAGWEDVVFQMCAVDAESLLPLGEALKVTEPRQVYVPGSVCAYSNWGTALAGYIVEQISGQPFYEYVQENIFKPLGMEHSSSSPLYTDNPWIKSKLLENEGYTADLMPIEDGLMYLNIYPCGSAAGTLNDFITFAKALVPDSIGSKRLFNKSETHDEMFSPTLTYPGTDIDYVNHGFWSHEFNIQTLGHGGNTMIYSSYLMIDPISEVGLVVMTDQG
ncbi:MAG TPA: methicillin resistance protein FmtA, partial [Firmicutes bacterium]|nr:methicillin resistance protein FmtA [Bacillota bacterium]